MHECEVQYKHVIFRIKITKLSPSLSFFLFLCLDGEEEEEQKQIRNHCDQPDDDLQK